MMWIIELLPEADRDLGELDSSVRAIVLKGIERREIIRFHRAKEVMESRLAIMVCQVLQTY